MLEHAAESWPAMGVWQKCVKMASFTRGAPFRLCLLNK